ncbi:MAG: hypothetical protein KF857_05840 [Fimbriimonadaceae bacterium]|nr:hypothetical protein [Fimbriimonadaceae bacterium]
MFWFVTPVPASSVTPDLTVVAVKETKVFTGRLGNRVFTDVTLRAADGRTLSVRIDDIRHDRFRPLRPAYQVGDTVRMVDGRLSRP